MTTDIKRSGHWSCHREDKKQSVFEFMYNQYCPLADENKEQLLAKARNAFICVLGRIHRLLGTPPISNARPDVERYGHLFPLSCAYVFGMYCLKNALNGINEITKKELIDAVTNSVDELINTGEREIIRNLFENARDGKGHYGQLHKVDDNTYFSIEKYIENCDKIYIKEEHIEDRKALKETYALEPFTYPYTNDLTKKQIQDFYKLFRIPIADSVNLTNVGIPDVERGSQTEKAFATSAKKRVKEDRTRKLARLKQLAERAAKAAALSAAVENETLHEAVTESRKMHTNMEEEKRKLEVEITTQVNVLDEKGMLDLFYRISNSAKGFNNFYFSIALHKIVEDNSNIFKFLEILSCVNNNLYKDRIPLIIDIIFPGLIRFTQPTVGKAVVGSPRKSPAVEAGASTAEGGAGKSAAEAIILPSEMSSDVVAGVLVLFNSYKHKFIANKTKVDLSEDLKRVKPFYSSKLTYDFSPLLDEAYEFYKKLKEVSFKECIEQFRTRNDIHLTLMSFLLIGLNIRFNESDAAITNCEETIANAHTAHKEVEEQAEKNRLAAADRAARERALAEERAEKARCLAVLESITSENRNRLEIDITAKSLSFEMNGCIINCEKTRIQKSITPRFELVQESEGRNVFILSKKRGSEIYNNYINIRLTPPQRLDYMYKIISPIDTGHRDGDGGGGGGGGGCTCGMGGGLGCSCRARYTSSGGFRKTRRMKQSTNTRRMNLYKQSTRRISKRRITRRFNRKN